MNISKYIKKSVSTGLGKSLGGAFIAVIFIPLIIRNIGIEQYGIWILLAIFFGLSSGADLGLSKSMVYFIPKQRSQEDINEVYSGVVVLNSFMVLFIGFIGFLVYWSGINIWGSTESFSYAFGRRLFLCGLVIACCSLATALCRSTLEAFYKIYIVNIGYFLQTVLNYTTVYVLSFFTKNVEHFVYMTTAVYILTYLLHIVMVNSCTSVSFIIPKFITIKNIIKYAFCVFFIDVLTSIIQPMNRYLIVLFSGDVRIYGIFDVALRVAIIATNCLQAFAVPLFSVFVGYGRERLDEIKQILNRCLMGLGGIYVLGCFLFFMMGKYIFELFLGNASLDLFNASLILILGMALFGVAEPFLRALLAIGDLRLSFMIKILQPTSNILFIIFLGMLSPLYRFSTAYALTYGIIAVMYIVMFKMKYPDPKKAFNLQSSANN